MAGNGYVKIYRKLLDNPLVCKDSDHLAVWIYLLLDATHTVRKQEFGGKIIDLQPGQTVTGRKVISSTLHVSESKVQRVLKALENEHQIEQQTTPHKRLISIINWSDYQTDEQPIKQQVNNKRTTTEQQVNTNKNDKNDKNVKNDIRIALGTFANVHLTDSEFEKLQVAFPDYLDRIERLSAYMESKGVTYKSHYATILNWARKDQPKPAVKYERIKVR